MKHGSGVAAGTGGIRYEGLAVLGEGGRRAQGRRSVAKMASFSLAGRLLTRAVTVASTRRVSGRIMAGLGSG